MDKNYKIVEDINSLNAVCPKGTKIIGFKGKKNDFINTLQFGCQKIDDDFLDEQMQTFSTQGNINNKQMDEDLLNDQINEKIIESEYDKLSVPKKAPLFCKNMSIGVDSIPFQYGLPTQSEIKHT